MGTGKSKGQRRSAAEWGRLIREQEESGQTPAAFALARGIRPDTFKWWRWRLGSKAKKAASLARKPRRVRLLAVQPVHEAAQPIGRNDRPVWELLAPTGYELRVYDQRGLGVLRAALLAVAGGRRR